MNKIIEMLTDRNNKLSIHKVCFFLGANVFLAAWGYAAFSSKTVPPMDSSIGIFMSVLGVTQLGKTFLENKKEENVLPPK